jgi:hypothetical protein
MFIEVGLPQGLHILTQTYKEGFTGEVWHKILWVMSNLSHHINSSKIGEVFLNFLM